MRVFSDPPFSVEEQIKLFRQRNLLIENVPEFSEFLSRVSFQRLKPYVSTFTENSTTYRFRSNTTEKDIQELYYFDLELQRIVLHALGGIEVAVKTKLINKVSALHGAHWFMDRNLFENSSEKFVRHYLLPNGQHESKLIEGNFFEYFISKMQERCGPDSEEVFVRGYFTKWDDPSFPPCWISLEELTFGTISKAFSALKVKEVKKEIAQEFGMVDFLFEAMLKSMVYVRNLCAHHRILWRRSLTIRPTLPRKKSNRILETLDGIEEKKMFLFLSCLIHLCERSNTDPGLKAKLLALAQAGGPEKLGQMGFPGWWNEEKLWQI